MKPLHIIEFFFFSLLFTGLSLNGQDFVDGKQLTFKTRAIGNSWIGASGKHMQNHITDIRVFDDGTVRTRSKWDEGGHPCAEYKEGAFLRKANCDANSKLAVDPEGNTWTIENYYGRFLDITANHGGQDATDAWRIDPVPTGENAPYIKCSDGREIRSIIDPSAIGINKKTGELLVADNSTEQNIKIFDIANGKDPLLTGSFGVIGGIYSGPEPGAKDDPLKFNGITGIGTDAEGNIYVACDGFPGSESEGGGADLRAFNPDGSLRWRMVGLMFVRAANIDPLGGGNDIYCPFTHYRVDYSKEPGHNMTDWTDVALTIDPFRYPDDPRLVGAVNTVLAIVNVNGTKYMYSTDMYNEPLYIHRFDGHIAVPVAVITMGYGWNGDEFRKFYWKHNRGRPTTPRWMWVDQNGDGAAQESEFELFEFGGPAERNSVQSFDVDQHGNMIFANKEGYWIIPTNGFDEFGTPQYSAENIIKVEREEIVERISLTMKYIEKEDILVEGGGSGWEVLNAHVYENWSDPAERKKRFTIIPPKPRVFNVTADHEYVYLTYGITDGPNTGKGGEILVYRLFDGAYVGYISPGPEVASYSGWIDMRQPTYVYVTPGGKRIICVEEDGVGKVLVYEWCPPGVNCNTDCTTEVDSVAITQSSMVLKGRQTDTLFAGVYPDTICFSKVFWISGDESVVTVSPAGVINSIDTGIAWVWAVSEQNPEIRDSLLVTVESVPVASINLHDTGDTLLLPVASSALLNIDILPTNAFIPELIWESADQTIASVDSSGLVAGLREGLAKITVRSLDGTFKDSCYIEVIPVPVSGVRFVQDPLHVWMNDPVFVEYKVYPENANNQEVFFAVLNEDIATVGTDGLLSGLAPGTAKLVITAQDGGFSDTCELQIYDENTLANTDIGSGCGEGGMTLTEDSIFILEANGADIWNSSDEFHFACRKVSGDMVLIARVRSLKNTDGWAKAGVMFRETMLPGSRFVMMIVTPGNGSSFQWRPQPDNGCEHHTPGDGLTAPQWVKLTREGNIFKGYNSINGKDWTPVSETESAMSGVLFAGLCLTAHNSNCMMTRSEFDYLFISEDINAQPQTPGEDATLSDLKADGLTIPDFQPDIYSYTIELDNETGAVPVIGAIPSDSEATVKISQAAAIPGNATIEVIAEDEFSKAIYQVRFTIATGLMSLPKNQIKIFPNPASHSIIIEGQQPFEEAVSVRVFDIAGILVSCSEQVKVQNGNKIEVDLSHLGSGFYVLEVGGKSVYRKNLMISK